MNPLIKSAALLVIAIIALPSQPAGADDLLIQPTARAQTEPVPHADDAADDPAIWVHPTDPAKSLILGTDKQGGLIVYDMNGRQKQVLNPGCRPNNVDVLYNFKFPAGPTTQADLAVASTRDGRCLGVKVWRIDPSAGRLVDATAGGVLKVFHSKTPYGICTYRSGKDGRCYFVVTDSSGGIEQHELVAADGGKVGARLVRKLAVKTTAEGCVADDEFGRLYVAEEDVGIWRFPAEPDAGDKGELVAKVGENGLTDDVEGLAIYAACDGKGYLIASSQGNNTFKVYTRDDNKFVATIDPKDAQIDDVSFTDGIAVTNCPTSPRFPAGLFIVQDGENKSGNQNFKLYDWRDIAGDKLIVDPKHPCRN